MRTRPEMAWGLQHAAAVHAGVGGMSRVLPADLVPHEIERPWRVQEVLEARVGVSQDAVHSFAGWKKAEVTVKH